jgi:chromosome partitioning protein
MVDLDPHGSLTAYFKFNPDQVESSVFDLFNDKNIAPASIIRKTAYENLALMPSSLALATVDRQLVGQEGMGLVIARALATVKNHFDHILIDCPPMLGVPMVNALAACDRLIIPVQTEFLALQGLERMVRTLGMITRARKTSLPCTILPTMFDRRTRASMLSLEQLQEKYGDSISNVLVPIDTQFRDASRLGIPLPLKAPNSRGAVAYGDLVNELMTTVEMSQPAVA